MTKTKFPLFSVYGIELEYMIVQRDNLTVLPISDQLIYEVSGEFQTEVEFEPIAWTNELVLHVIEFKTNRPAPSLLPLAEYFQHEVQRFNQLLEKYDAKLLPTGTHPWMNPDQEVKLWPHGDRIIYETYNKIFNCKGHGWSNLQSVHLNLPFASDAEFAKLHTAIRVLLPIIPALCASTPIIEGKVTGFLDTRLDYYRKNQCKIPMVTGKVVPELVFSEREYIERILEPMYKDIAIEDPQKVLQEEWLNSRGAIARFDRNAIEVRIIDTQECPAADLAIIKLIVAALKKLIRGQWISFEQQVIWPEDRLAEIFNNTIQFGRDTVIEDEDYIRLFGLGPEKIKAGELWSCILQEVASEFIDDKTTKPIIDYILLQGNLAERILRVYNHQRSLKNLKIIFQDLASCLQLGKLYLS